MNQPKADPFQDLVQREERGLVKLYANRLSALRAKPDDAALEDEMAQIMLRRLDLVQAKQHVTMGKKTNPINLAGTVLFRETAEDRQKSEKRLSKHQTVTEAYLKTLDAEYVKMTGLSFIAQHDPSLHEHLSNQAIRESSVLSAAERKQVLAETLAAGETTNNTNRTATLSKVEQTRAMIKPPATPRGQVLLLTMDQIVGQPAPLPARPARPVSMRDIAEGPTPSQLANVTPIKDAISQAELDAFAARRGAIKPVQAPIAPEPVVEQPQPALFADLSAELPKDFPPRLGGASRAYWELRHALEIKSLQTAERQFGKNPAQLDAHLKAAEIRLRIEADEAAKNGTVRLPDPAHKTGYYNYKAARTSEEKTALARQTYDYLSLVHNARAELADRHPEIRPARLEKTAADRAVEPTTPMPLDVPDAPRERGRLRTFFTAALSNGLGHFKGVYGNVKEMFKMGSKAGNDDFNPDSELVAKKSTGTGHFNI